jgi:hypothetical protein
VVVQSAGDLDGKSIACAAAAVKRSVEAAAMAEVSVNAISQVTTSCSSHTSS